MNIIAEEGINTNYNKIFEESYFKLLDTLDDKVTFTNIVAIIIKSVEIVEKYSKLKGYEKKFMVIKMVSTLINKHEKDEEVKKAMIDLLDTVGVSVIDGIIYAASGKLIVNLKKWKKYLCLICRR